MHLAMILMSMSLTAESSAKILGIAAAVYALLQMAKQIFPSIGGKWALALNVGLSVLGFLVTVSPSNLLTLDTFTGLVVAVGAAAGIHGTVKNLSAAS